MSVRTCEKCGSTYAGAHCGVCVTAVAVGDDEVPIAIEAGDFHDSHVRELGSRAEVEADGELLAPSTVLGSYRILRLIGEGGLGHVYLAEHIKLGRKVALKTLRQSVSRHRGVVKRFFAEARAVNQISHEHIVQITDFVEESLAGPYLIMELLEGSNLGDLLEKGGVIPVPRALRIGAQIASALSAAHDAGIVHRDLKPENIFILKRGGNEDYVKLLDFGIAKLTQKNDPLQGSIMDTGAGAVMGTPAYMSPEQAVGHTVDHRTDIYALGIILYEMVTGELPIKGNTLGEFVVAHTSIRPMRPSKIKTLPQPVPRDLEEIALRCLEKEPQRRPTNVKDVEKALLDIIEQYESGTVKVSRRRPRLWWPLALAGAIFVALGVGGITWWMSLANEPEPVVVAPPPPPLPPAPSNVVSVRFESIPSGAQVRRVGTGELLGVTPLTAQLRRSDHGGLFEFRKEGYQSLTVQLSLTESTRAFVALNRVPPAAAPVIGEAAPAIPVRPLPVRPVVRPHPPSGNEPTKLGRTSILDPFGGH